MLPLVWLPEARADLRAINEYIAPRNPVAAARLLALVEAAAQRIRSYPEMYRPGRVEGIREAIAHPNYVLVYRVAEIIEIVAVLHARQQYP